jgi:oligoendopeptidase F
MGKQKYNMKWDLDSFFPGGSASPEFEQFVNDLSRRIDELKRDITKLATLKPATPDRWHETLTRAQEATSRLYQASAFVSCLTAQDVKDEKAKLWRGRLTQLGAVYRAAMTAMDDALLKVPDSDWAGLLQDERLQPIAFFLEERRRHAKEKLSPEMETLAGDLSVDGYHAWGQLYNTVVGRIQIPVEEKGKTVHLSVGQASNRLSHPDRRVRQSTFAALEKAWSQEAELCAASLNHLAGYRLNLYRHRGWDSVLKEPLDDNRMSAETLETMWQVIEKNKPRLIYYMDRKALLLGVDALSWYDLSAPLPGEEKQIPYDEAADFIVEQFGHFDPEMAKFARHAFENRWIEAEDRPGKRPGGFCTSFKLSRQSRIFMTYAGTASNVSTLAHELGHAYHQHVMNDLPEFAQDYAMNVAETASTFAELIVTDAAIRHASSAKEKLKLVEDKLQRAVAFFMDIHARFLFETRFYERRKQGPVSVEELNALMLQAQKDGFHHALSVYHPYMWASKLHFYITGAPFYNFPYTFGYLFSTGIYARAQAEGPSFARKYVALLRDTGRMTVEDLAKKHLGVDLTQPEFWQSAVDAVLEDVDLFLELTETK